MAQARKIKPVSAKRNIANYLKRGVQKTGFGLFTVIALYLCIALVFFDPRDAGWTHTGPEQANNLAGAAGAWFADITLYFFGYLAYWFPAGIALCGWRLFQQGAWETLDAEIVIFRSLGFGVALATGCGLASFYFQDIPGSGSAGGLCGDLVGQGLIGTFSALGGYSPLIAKLFMGTLLVASFTLATGRSWLDLLELLGKLTVNACTIVGQGLAGLQAWLTPPSFPKDTLSAPSPAVSESVKSAAFEDTDVRELPTTEFTESTTCLGNRNVRIEPVMALPQTEALTLAAEPMLATPEGSPVPEAQSGELVLAGSSDGRRHIAKREPVVSRRITAAERPPRPEPTSQTHAVMLGEIVNPLPPLQLLDPAPTTREGYAPDVLQGMARQVETLLRHFGIEVSVVAIAPGPVITRFELEPAPGVKGSQISNLSKDLARGLSVISIRIVEVIPGKSVVGLEIPNQHREIVYLGEILDSPAYHQASAPMTLALGKDISGNPVVTNLAKMPHLLVAGTTGSGKSVAVNAMLLSLLYKATPQEVRLILVDPKMLELSVYEDIPHLLAPVVTDMKEAANALRWCVGEMERRYRLMAALKVRNITGYNRKINEANETGTPLSDPFYKPEDSLGGGANLQHWKPCRSLSWSSTSWPI